MEHAHDPETELLLRRAARGEDEARRWLLERHRGRLKRMVAARLDPRLAARLDPSDIVQEALVDAHQKLDQYARERPLPFYPWLRRLAWERVLQAHRYHGRARRSIDREEPDVGFEADASALHLADRLAAGGTGPGDRLLREERRRRLRAMLEQLPATDREVLVMRYLEELPFDEIAAVLGATPGAVKVRHFRALERIRKLLDEESLR